MFRLSANLVGTQLDRYVRKFACLRRPITGVLSVSKIDFILMQLVVNGFTYQPIFMNCLKTPSVCWSSASIGHVLNDRLSEYWKSACCTRDR